MMNRAQCGRCGTWRRTIVDERLGLLYLRARRYGRSTSLRRNNRGEILESKRGTKARLGRWTKRDEDDEKKEGT